MELPDIPNRRIVVERFGDVDELRLVDEVLPAPPSGAVRVKVLAAGVGFTDIMARTGDYLLQRRTPLTPGYELVGEVVDARPGSSGAVPRWAQPGTRVAASLPHMGAYSEYVTMPDWLPVPVPDGLDTIAAASIPLDYLTALSLLETHGHVREGHAILVHGVSGGVGRAVVQLAHRAGVRIYGTASSATAQDMLADAGVRVIDYRRDDFEQVIKREEPHGVQAVFDHIGGDYLRRGLRILAPRGVLVSYAFSGRPGHMVADTIRGALTVTLLGLRPGKRTALCMVPRQIASDHHWYRDSLERLLTMAATGEIEPVVGATFALEKAADAHHALQRREASGKLVLTT
ncbi:quinone oxidoreductase family protein [Phytoactinopolyspora halotolerans]|uniref:Zinc-binding dehydrogenase n=1 Tax=Phytoactinopolyspora halotolerans TaxID=1981512 RepID=A0A6L9S4L3_9ACTN|nr:zinc-binding dehydrogenase [Phytoactinopolyspora halotolerans]NED99942.1 zinc-binding dehydrogenase [Phytoactinopolyspora halotolerans]